MAGKIVRNPDNPSVLHHLRTQRGLSLRKLAALVPCSHARIFTYENGLRMPDHHARRLAQVLGVSIDALRGCADAQ